MLQLRQLRFYFQFGRVHPNNVWGRKVAVTGGERRERERERLEIATQGYAVLEKEEESKRHGAEEGVTFGFLRARLFGCYMRQY